MMSENYPLMSERQRRRGEGAPDRHVDPRSRSVSKLRLMNVKLHIEGSSDLNPWILRNGLRRRSMSEVGARVE